MSGLLTVVPDKTYLITEERLRFSVDATVPPNAVPFIVAKDLQKSIDILERLRGWKRMETVPARTAFPLDKVCCEQMRQKPGTTIGLRFLPSNAQGDLDDMTNFGLVSDENKRFYVDGLIDWVAVVHFWQPAVVINNDAEKEANEALYTPTEGFARWEDLPLNAWSAARKRFAPSDHS